MKKLFLATILCLGLFACSDDEGSGGSGNYITHKLIKTTIQDAEYIYGSSPSNTRSLKSSSGNFWTINAKGQSNPIQFLTDNDETKDMSIENIYDINDQYVIMKGAFQLTFVEVPEGEDPFNTALVPYILVNKKTGAIYEFPFWLGDDNSTPTIYTDKDANFYLYDFKLMFTITA